MQRCGDPERLERIHPIAGYVGLGGAVAIATARAILHPFGSGADGFALLAVILGVTGIVLLADHVHGTATDGSGTMSVVNTLTKAQESDMMGAGNGHPAIGSSVHLWRVDGLWRVWSTGPKRGTWWLMPNDALARAVLELVRAGDAGAPVIVDVYLTANTHAIAVASRELRARITIGGEA